MAPFQLSGLPQEFLYVLTHQTGPMEDQQQQPEDDHFTYCNLIVIVSLDPVRAWVVGVPGSRRGGIETVSH